MGSEIVGFHSKFMQPITISGLRFEWHFKMKFVTEELFRQQNQMSTYMKCSSEPVRTDGTLSGYNLEA